MTEHNYQYNPLPIHTASFPARRPSMCIITDQLVEYHRAAKIQSPGDVAESIKDISDTELMFDIDSEKM